MDWVVAEFKKENGVDLSQDKPAMQRIREASEKAKCDLSSQVSATIDLAYITSIDNNPVHLNLTLTRSKFESLISDLLERIKKPVKEVLSEGVDKSKIKEILLVGGSTRVPAVVQLIEDLVGIKASKGVNPDLAVAEGACELANTLEGGGSIVLVDVTPLSLGIEVNGGINHVLIPKNTSIPCSKKETFTTAADNQPSVDIVIAQGERPMSRDNKVLGTFQLSGIAPARRGVPQIEVEFSLDTNGILSVNAKDLGTGKAQSITITQSGNLDQEEIDRMVKEAEEFKEKDEETKAFVMLKNEVETLVINVESSLELAKDKVEEELINNVNDAITKTREALTSGNKEEIEKQKDNLLTQSHKISEILYQNVQPNEQVIEPDVVQAD
jgi:molecular chaperone DnaK